NPQNGSARRVGNGIPVDNVVLSIKQRMERHVVQHLMRNNDQALALSKIVSNRRDQQIVQRLQVMSGRGQKRSGVFFEIRRLKVEFRQLKIQTSNAGAHILRRGKFRKDVELVFADDKCQKVVADRIVLHE